MYKFVLCFNPFLIRLTHRGYACLRQANVPESMSSYLGLEASEGLTQKTDDDSLSAESLDSVSQGSDLKYNNLKIC